jgi:hypothetical protein
MDCSTDIMIRDDPALPEYIADMIVQTTDTILLGI